MEDCDVPDALPIEEARPPRRKERPPEKSSAWLWLGVGCGGGLFAALLCGGIGFYLWSGGGVATPGKPFVLSNATKSQGIGPRVTFEAQLAVWGRPDQGGRYVWLIRGVEGGFVEVPLRPEQVTGGGKLRANVIAPATARFGAFECSIIRSAGRIGFREPQGETVSNVIRFR